MRRLLLLLPLSLVVISTTGFVYKVEEIASFNAHVKEIKAGQVWAIENDKSNPFEREKKPVAAHVVDVKEGYVKYCFVGTEGHEELACSESAGRFARVFTKRIL